MINLLKNLFNPHYLIFSKAWFELNQLLLLKLANSWIGRKILCIDGNKSSVGKYKIREVGKNYIKWTAGRYYKAEFRTHDKFAKRIKYAFYPIWYLLHIWDTLFANNFQPNWNFGFDTLTAYPAAGQAAPVDGFVYQNSAGGDTWANIKAAAGTTARDSADPDYWVGMWAFTTTNVWQIIGRGICLFDTSALTAGATISAATLSIYGDASTTSDGLSGTPDINIYTSNPAATNLLAGTDYATLGSIAQCDTAIAYASWVTNGYNNFAFNSIGKENISKTGISKFGTRNVNHDVANSAPPWVNGASSLIGGNFADHVGTTQDPKLVVTYTTSAIKTFNGLAKASVKTFNGLAIASVKTINGLA